MRTNIDIAINNDIRYYVAVDVLFPVADLLFAKRTQRR
jgi:hypothetical protein